MASNSNPQEALAHAADERPKRRPSIVMTSPPPHILALFFAWFAAVSPRLVPIGVCLAGLCRLYRGRLRSSVLRRASFIFVIGWVANYLHSVRRVHLRLNPKSSRLAYIVHQCPSLTSLYWPTWCAPQSLLQVLLLLCKEARSRLLQRYRREILCLQDGAYIAIDWVDPAPSAKAKATGDSEGTLPPVCVLLHGAFMDSSSSTMADLANSLASRGFPVAVMNRRGYGGIGLQGTAQPKLAIYGFDADLDEVLASVGKREPGRPVAIIGFSCGSGFGTRYVGRRSDRSVWSGRSLGAEEYAREQEPQILCMVSIDGAYDASPEAGPALLMRWPYSWITNWSVKFFYVYRHRKALRQAGYTSLVDRTLRLWPGILETYQNIMDLAGTEGVDAWMRLQSPCLRDIKIPSLFVNSRDDPICVWENVELALHEINSNPNIAHAELYCGTHGCKYGFLGFSSHTDAMVGEFVLGSWCELNRVQKASRGLPELRTVENDSHMGA